MTFSCSRTRRTRFTLPSPQLRRGFMATIVGTNGAAEQTQQKQARKRKQKPKPAEEVKAEEALQPAEAEAKETEGE